MTPHQVTQLDEHPGPLTLVDLPTPKSGKGRSWISFGKPVSLGLALQTPCFTSCP